MSEVETEANPIVIETGAVTGLRLLSKLDKIMAGLRFAALRCIFQSEVRSLWKEVGFLQEEKAAKKIWDLIKRYRSSLNKQAIAQARNILAGNNVGYFLDKNLKTTNYNDLKAQVDEISRPYRKKARAAEELFFKRYLAVKGKNRRAVQAKIEALESLVNELANILRELEFENESMKLIATELLQRQKIQQKRAQKRATIARTEMVILDEAFGLLLEGFQEP